MELVLNELLKMQTEPVTSKELQQAKALLIAQTLLGRSSEDAIAGTFLDLSVNGLPIDEPAQAAKYYVIMTAEQVQAAFKKWVRPDNFVQIVRGPQPE